MMADEHQDEPMAPGDEAPPSQPAAAENACPDCEGTGRRDGKPCPSCGGTGSISEAVGGG